MKDVENTYREQPLRSVPREWKQEILASANAAQSDRAPSKAMKRSAIASIFSIVPRPLAYPLAAAWMIIAFLRIQTPAIQPASVAQMIAGAQAQPIRTPEAARIRAMIWGSRKQQSEMLALLTNEQPQADIEPDSLPLP